MELICRLKTNKNKEPYIYKNFDQNIPHYQGVIAGDIYFYALYNKKGRKMNEYESASQIIEVFDYDGNAIAEYSFDDYINLFALDKINHVLYAYDITKEDFILKYNLPKNIAYNPES
jgi:hypothetical protein